MALGVVLAHPDAAIHSAALVFAVALAFAGLDRIDEIDVRSKISSKVKKSIDTIEQNVIDYIKSRSKVDGVLVLDSVVGTPYVASVAAVCLFHGIENNLPPNPRLSDTKGWTVWDKGSYKFMTFILRNKTGPISRAIAPLVGIKFYLLSYFLIYDNLSTGFASTSLIIDFLLFCYFGVRVTLLSQMPSCGKIIGTETKKWHQESLNETMVEDSSIARPIT